MEIPVYVQLAQTGASLLTGVAIGMLYDLLGPLRRSSWLSALLTDILFWICCGAALLALGMGIGEGQLRLFMLLTALAGAALYRIGPGRFVRPALEKLSRFIGKIFGIIRIPFSKLRVLMKKAGLFLKKHFTKARKWFTITCTSVFKTVFGEKGRRNRAEERENEAKAGRYYYENSYSGADAVRRHKPAVSALSRKRGAAGAGRSRGSGRGGNAGKRRA